MILVSSTINCQEDRGYNSPEGTLNLRFRNLNFVKNNEYSNPVIEGYTLIGYFLNPEFVYFPSEKVTLRLGAHLLQYSGTNKFNLIKPVFSTSYSVSENLVFIMGSLDGSDKHRMFDPHFNKEKLYNLFSEDGLELLFCKDNLFNDVWINWENFIFKGDNEREIFTAGESFSYESDKIINLFRIRIPFQILFKHYGGQISNYPEHVETYFNLASGAGISFDIGEKEYGEAGLEGLLFYGKTLTANAPSGINKGHGEWFKAFYDYKSAGIEAGVWISHDFYAPDGNFIFSSVSDYRSNVVIHDRKLLTCSAHIKLLHKAFLEFYLGFDGFYDPDLHRFDNAATLHLRVDKIIKLATVGK
jgi:hypothetical protein